MTSAATTTKQTIRIHSTAIIADKASLSGIYDIEIGDSTVIHPYAKLKADGGKIIIGAFCTIAEGVNISTTDDDAGDVIIEDYVQVDSSATVAASRISRCSRLGIQSVIRTGSSMGVASTLPPKAVLNPNEHLVDFSTLLHGSHVVVNKTTASQEMLIESRKQLQKAEIAVLRKLIPKSAAKYVST